MTDIFISYARSTATQAHAIAEALRTLGYSVWRDDELPAHRGYTEVIEEHLQAAKAVVVIWSADAAKSEWVQSEADTARTDRKLVQLTVDGARLPRPFDRIQCADLSGWSGEADAHQWRKVVSSVAELLGVAPSAASNRPDPPFAPAPPKEPLLAVLPFENLSDDREMQFFSDGVSEEILQTVAQGAELKVIGRSSSFQFRGPDKAARNVAAQLKATHILDGSVRRSGSRVRITAQLVECATEVSLWSDRFDRDLTDIFALQDEIASAVARGLKIAFAPSATPTAIDPDIYDLYLRAVAIWGGTFQAAPRAEGLEMLEQVVAAAPGFARAWSIVAIARAEMRRLQFAWTVTAAPGKLISAASVEAAADTALRLDPNLGLAHVALSLLEPWGCYAAQEAPCIEALTVSPNETGVLTSWSNYCSWVGRMREALDAAKRALDLDPLSWMAALIHAAAVGWVGRDTEACRLWDDLLARWSDIEGYEGATLHAAVIGDWPRVDRLFAKARDLNVAPQRVEAMAAFLQALRTSDDAFATNMLNLTRQNLAERGVVLLDVPVVLHRLGLRDEAYQLIDEASFDHMFDPEGHPPAARFPSIIFQPLAASLRSDPRFAGLCAKIGLVDYWMKTDRWPDCSDEGVLPYDFKAECRRLAGAAA